MSRRRREAGTAHVLGARGGRQRFSWIHLDGPVNAAAPHPSDNAGFMAAIRRALGVRIGVPVPRWMLEIGAIGIRTETELILKSRWVLPKRLTAAGYVFRHPDLDEAVRDALGVPALQEAVR